MKSFVGYIIDKGIKAIPRSKKVSPTIKSIKPTKDVKGSVKRTKQDQYLKNIGDLNKAQKKITEGKKLVKEGVKSRKQMVGTKRAFQFKNIKSYHAVEPGSKKINPASIKQEKTKKFKTAKQMEKEERRRRDREGFMGGGMMGRRMGYSEGKLAVTPREKQLAAQYGDKKRITRGDVITAAKSKSGKRMQAANGTEPLSPLAIRKFMKTQKGKKSITQRTRGNTQPPEEPMRDRMKQPLKKKGS